MEKEKNIFIAKIDENQEVCGFYTPGVHSEEVCEEARSSGVLITSDLWQVLLSYGQARLTVQAYPLIEEKDNILDLKDLDKFERIKPQPVKEQKQKPTAFDLQNRIEELEKVIKTLVEKS